MFDVVKMIMTFKEFQDLFFSCYALKVNAEATFRMSMNRIIIFNVIFRCVF